MRVTDHYEVGDVVLGNWTLVKRIGKGSFGTVFEAQRKEFGITYRAAIKIITIPYSQSEINNARSEGMDENSITEYYRDMVSDIVQEIALMSKFKGTANVVAYEDHAVIEHKDCISWDVLIRMELLTPLLKYTEKRQLSDEEIIHVGMDICNALEMCQKYNIIHRDIKPENIFVSEFGDFKLGDFGIARTIEKTTGELSKKGTYSYMAPEVYNDKEYDSSVDIYSLGIVMYRLLNCNRTPFLPLPPHNITYLDREAALVRRMNGEPLPTPANAQGRLAEIVLKACAICPKDRYSSPLFMKMELEALLTGRRAGIFWDNARTTKKTEGSVDRRIEISERNTDETFSEGTVLDKPSDSFQIRKERGNDNDEHYGKKYSKKWIKVFLSVAILLICCWVTYFAGGKFSKQENVTVHETQSENSIPITTVKSGLSDSIDQKKATETRKGSTPPIDAAKAQKESNATPTEATNDSSFAAGDVITFGRYEQDNNRQNGSEPIEWLVLDVQNEKALLLSKYALDAKPYHDRYGSITWEDCSLREWLNGDFLNAAFSEAEKNSVLTAEIDNSKSQGYHEWRTDGGNSTVDKVFLLSDAEAWFYFGSDVDRRCTPTAYASAMGADFKTENGEQYATGWWLRSPGENEYSAEYVNFRGDHISNVVGNGYVSIRPAVWVSSTAELKPQ